MADHFGQYRLVERIAAGGMGEVFKAKLTREGGFEKVVAVKRLLPALSANMEFEDRFRSEARLTARLTHNNIVHVYDFGKIGDSLFLAMEYVDGVNLAALLKRLNENGERMAPALAIEVAIQICRGLDVAHRLRDEQNRSLHLIHRDISPSNVLISCEGEVKLTDFGIASVRDSTDDENLLAGKLAYISPELAIGQNLDLRADIYATGLVLFEMLYGYRAFDDKLGRDVLLRNIATGKIEFPDDDLIPEDLAEIVKTACHADKRQRYATARQMEQALQPQHDIMKTGQSESLSKLVHRLFPDHSGTHRATAERTILSTRPISVAPTQTVTRHEIRKALEPPSKPRYKLWGTLLVIVAIISMAVYLMSIPKGAITVVSTPSRAKIFIDDNDTGQRTPARIGDLRADREYRVRLVLPFYNWWEKTITLHEDAEVSLTPELERNKQDCRLVTDPPGARVWLNDKLLKDLTPVDLGKIPLGVKHALRIEKEMYVPLQTEFILERLEDETKVFTYDLQALYKKVVINLQPSSAALYVDGRRVDGQSPYEVDQLLPGRSVKLLASMKGYSSTEMEIIPDNQNDPIEVKLTPFSADLTFSAPPGWAIRHSGKTVGNRLRIHEAQKAPQLVSFIANNGKDKLVLRIIVNQSATGDGRYRTRASLNLDAHPWATIRMDGGNPLTTPISGKILNSGKHAIGFELGGNAPQKTLSLTIQ